MPDTKPLSMLDCLGQEFMVGDICLLTYYDHGDSTLEPILIVKLDEDTDSCLKPNRIFRVYFVHEVDMREKCFVFDTPEVIEMFKITNPEFYLQDGRIVNLISFKKEILSEGYFRGKTPSY